MTNFTGQISKLNAQLLQPIKYFLPIGDQIIPINKYINSEIKIEKGKAFARMSAQSVAHLLMVIFIIIGNIAYYYSRKEN